MASPADGQRAHNGVQPSNATFTLATYGAATAVSAMTNAQLGTFYFTDVSLGAKPSNAGPLGGLKAMLADGRLDSTNYQIAEDGVYCRRTLGLGNGD